MVRAADAAPWARVTDSKGLGAARGVEYARGMTAPRQILPKTIYFVTRRCARREFLLRPSKMVNRILLYALAITKERFHVDIHAFCVMSNHLHLVVSDPRAELPAFLQYLNGQVAKAMNCHLDRCESFWGPGSYNAVELLAPGDVIDKTAYALANPAAEGLVRTGAEWPGLWSKPKRIGGKPYVARRPKVYFDAEGELPEQIELQLTVPRGFASPDEFRGELEAALAIKEAEAYRQYGGRFLGVKAVLAMRPTHRPATPEPRGEGRIRPRIAARDKWLRIEALQRLKGFLAAYREAWAEWTAGRRSVVFPPGTYLLRVAHGVACASG